ncbi:hypothetical protein NDN11_04200 [Acinetobacter sp. C26M]|uniref:hypothetical protein n=1 Tax=unclassified Acinetobacter TaxID=196816 RepID=UPI0020367195|nr:MULTISPECIES: hypothetical protein [unclassified Acinetobacter]USA47333.1 hypothetical protein NDN11_04200 [Acinetobacter sp. C26M]USA50814.1 hypothetical protein NDN12_04200 [Acinetobacter sp. C26G]
MNIKFITIGILIIGALYFGTEKYWQHEFEEQQRNELKNLVFDEKMQEEIKELPIKGDILNQYPNIFLYMSFTIDLPRDIETQIKSKLAENSQKLVCSYFSEVSDQDDKYKDRVKAIINVVEQDNITMTYIAKNRLGNTLLEYNQVLSQCPEFISLKQSIS